LTRPLELPWVVTACRQCGFVDEYEPCEIRVGVTAWRSVTFFEGRREGGCSALHGADPVSIPHDIEQRGVTTGTNREPNPQVNGLITLPPQVMGSAGTPSQGGVVVRGDSCWRGRRQRTNLIRQPPLMQATPPHPPSCTGDGGRHDVREDPFSRSAMSYKVFTST
jgi:hypothetical protein